MNEKKIIYILIMEKKIIIRNIAKVGFQNKNVILYILFDGII